MDLFYDLRERHLFKSSYEHTRLLRYSCLGARQKELDEHKHHWNAHVIRPVRQSNWTSGWAEVMYHLPHRWTLQTMLKQKQQDDLLLHLHEAFTGKSWLHEFNLRLDWGCKSSEQYMYQRAFFIIKKKENSFFLEAVPLKSVIMSENLHSCFSQHHFSSNISLMVYLSFYYVVLWCLCIRVLLTKSGQSLAGNANNI